MKITSINDSILIIDELKNGKCGSKKIKLIRLISKNKIMSEKS